MPVLTQIRNCAIKNNNPEGLAKSKADTQVLAAENRMDIGLVDCSCLTDCDRLNILQNLWTRNSISHVLSRQAVGSIRSKIRSPIV